MWDDAPRAGGATGMTADGSPETIVNAALKLDREGRVAEAIAAYQRILVRWPGLADIWYNLAVLQRGTRELDAALASYAHALAAGIRRPEEVHLNRSVIYTDYLGQHVAAARELNAALALNPDFVPALMNLANLHEDWGRRAEARELLARVLALDPKQFEALARYANLEAGSGDPALVLRLSAALADPTPSAAERASLGFALGRLLDARGDYRDAFAAYARANRDSRASVGPGYIAYDRARQAAFTDRLIAVTAARVPPREGVAMPPRPIFICGMFRSGSTLAEQLLASGAGLVAGGELDSLPRIVSDSLAPFPDSLATLTQDRCAALARRYKEEVGRRFPGAAAVIDKRPDNFLYIGLIKTLFPDARIVHTVREPLDNCLSIFFVHLDHGMPYALDLMEIGHYFREYRRLMAHWKTRFGDDIYDLSYDELVRAPEATLAGLGRFLGVEFTNGPEVASTARAIKTASVWQVREPLYQSSSGRAAHYACELKDLRAFLAGLLPE